MKEVSCRALDLFFRRLEQEGRPTEPLLEGVPYDLAHLRDRHERIDWSAYRQLMANAGRLWSDDELVAIGGSFLMTPLLKPMSAIARLLFSASEFYKWVNGPDKGFGRQMFACVVPTWRQLAEDRIVTELRLEPGHAYCREFFVVSQGGLASFPRVLGLKPARVEMVLTDWGAEYDIGFPHGGGTLGKVKRAVTWPFTARTVARELQDAHVTLQARYEQLEAARAVLARQATQLRTAQRISQVIHGQLDLDRTLQAVADALVAVGEFAAARVTVAADLDLDLDRERIEREAAAGVVPAREDPLEVPLEGRGRTIGRLTLWPTGGADRDERRALLETVSSTIAVTIDDALAFTELSSYRATLEARVGQRTADLSEARDALADTVTRLQDAQRAKDRIFANINHEIRTPLALIKLAVADLRGRLGEAVEPAVSDPLVSIGASVRRLLRMVDALLLLAAGEESKLTLTMAPTDLAVVAGTVVASFRPLATAEALELGYRGPRTAWTVVDEHAVERILANLVSNAIKFTPRGGRVEIEIAETASHHDLVVRDTGIGIDEEFRARIFGRFEQGRPPVRRGASGSGLGLSLVRELAIAHGGEVEVESPRHGGTIFRVRLPRRHASDLPAQRERAARVSAVGPADFGLVRSDAAPPRRQGTPAESLGTVLVAEDDAALAEAIGQMLGRSYTVLQANDGLGALRLAEANLPDALITDLGMPGMDGLELARRFRALPGNRLAPVLILTAFTGVADRLAGFEAGAVDYVAKPFEPEELLARLRSQLAVRDLALRLHRSEQLAALGSLSAGLAHELRNPVNAIVNAIGPLRKVLPASATAPGTASAELIEVLDECAAEVARLSRQLLGFQRPGALELVPARFDAIVQRATVLAGRDLERVTLALAIDDAGEVRCAAPLVVQVLTNLLGNAAQAAGPGGRVELHAARRGERLVVEITDSGPGVPIELRERIFEPFFTTKAPGQGTGLGLSTAREIAAQHGGLLEVRGAGPDTIFTLELPLAGPVPAVQPAPPATVARSSG